MFEELDLILPAEAFGGPMQMALDELLLRKASCPTLRIYRWSAPCVTFGYFQKFTEVRSAHPILPVIRRRTGGGMVEHGNDLTFSLMIPRENKVARISPSLFYKKLHHALATLLRQTAKKEIRLAGEEEILSGPSCFSAPAQDDLLCQGRKILGGAQCRSAGALLYQGSLQGMEEMGGFAHLLASSLSAAVSETWLETSMIEEAVILAEGRYAASLWNERR